MSVSFDTNLFGEGAEIWHNRNSIGETADENGNFGINCELGQCAMNHFIDNNK